jgi:gas vesicle protein
MGDRESSNSGSFLGGILLGAVVGLALGFIFAPQSGKETRAMLKEKAIEVKDKAGELVQKARKATSDMKEDIEARTE